MVRTLPFTFTEPHIAAQNTAGAPYTLMARPQAPSVRSANLPPVVAPAQGGWGWTKTALPPYAAPGWWATRAPANGTTQGR